MPASFASTQLESQTPRFGNPTTIHSDRKTLYINKSMSHSALAGLYRMSRIGLVTPLRDGMNLVAKEYVAAQAPDNPGVLVLSQFAGAAQELKSALIVNPYDIEATAAAIARAFTMPLDERKDRWHAMMAALRAQSRPSRSKATDPGYSAHRNWKHSAEEKRQPLRDGH